jgi:hypothetical protein
MACKVTCLAITFGLCYLEENLFFLCECGNGRARGDPEGYALHTPCIGLLGLMEGQNRIRSYYTPNVSGWFSTPGDYEDLKNLV